MINKNSSSFGLKVTEGKEYVSDPRTGLFMARDRLSRFYGFKRDVMVVPCGKCIECLKKRQNDLALRCMREASKRGSMHFLTLTYDDAHLPLSVRLAKVDKSTGEVFYDYPATPLVRLEDSSKEASQEYLAFVRGKLSQMELSSSARVVVTPFFEDEDFLFQFEVTPSLHRRDVRLWLKKCRVRYQRQFGTLLPDFSYVIVGEYGPKTCRPHYHLAFFGLSRNQVQYLRDQWEYGSITDLQTVSAVNEDGSNGFEIASRYIGKYMSKGKFECDSVKCGLSEKPRLMLSRGVGCDLPDSLLYYFRCYDLFGKYDIEHLTLEDGSRLSPAQLDILYKEVKKRSFFEYGSAKYAIPRNLLLKIWFNYGPDKVYRASQFRRLYSASLSCDIFRDFISKRLKGAPGISEREVINEAFEFLACSERSALLQEEFDERNLSTFYANSEF